MIRNITIIFLLCVTTSLVAQNHSTYEDFYKSNWEFPYNWTNKDTIELKLAEKRDLKELKFGEFISFNKNKKVAYQHFIPCPVGETLKNIENFLISQNKVDIYYKTKAWDADDSKWKKKHHKYRILRYDDTTMTLVRM